MENIDSSRICTDRRELLKLAGGVAATTTALSVATEKARAGSVYWDGVTLSQSGYDYGPSVMYGDGSRIKMWWCAANYGDAIYYSELTASGWTSPQVVMTSSSYGWDSYHVCDPSVVKGNFTADGSSWEYAMYYTGSTTGDGTDDELNNHIGVAFSNDGTSWHKYSGNPVIYPKYDASGSYGAGMPAAYRAPNYDDYVYVAFYDSTDGNRNHYETATDGTSFGSRTTLTADPHSGTAIGGIAYDSGEDRWYVSAKDNSDRVSYLYTTESSWLNSTWTHQATIGGGVTGYTHNHNPCWMTWPNGDLRADANGYSHVYLGVGSSDPNSWDIGQVRYRG